MVAPLEPTPSTALNSSSEARPPSQQGTSTNRSSLYENSVLSSDGESSPFLSHVKDDVSSPTTAATPTPRGPSPPKHRPGSRIISGTELSPLKILQQNHAAQQQGQSTSENGSQSSGAKSVLSPQSPRKPPIKRFPIKVSAPGVAAESARQSLDNERRLSSTTSDTAKPSLPVSEELKKRVIDIFEDDDDNDEMMLDIDDDNNKMMAGSGSQDGNSQNGHHANGEMDEHTAANDSVMSSFSTFSAVPDLTTIGGLRGANSSAKFSSFTGETTPRARPGDVPTRTPRSNGLFDSGQTPNLIDFSARRYGAGGRYEPEATPSRQVAATPGRSGTLLDLDVPPAPTPRSIPSITPRELESLKSQFMSEISSLKASLSGKEAEVQSLKTAVTDAEKRVGECMEQLREVQCAHDALAAEKQSWEQRSREMETMLRKMREELLHLQREREELEFKLDEAEKRREAAEMMAQDAESKMAGMRAGAAAAAAASGDKSAAHMPSNKEIEIAVERVARELHTLYKNKHETKVAALKKSYEARWEKKVRELQAQVDDLVREKEEMRARELGANRIDPGRLAELEEERQAERARAAAQIRELEAEVEKLEAVLKTVQADNAELRVLLERERVEKGELVMLAEEMMAMQQSFLAGPEEQEPPTPAPKQNPPQPEPAPAPAPAPAPNMNVPSKTPTRRQSSSAPLTNHRPLSVASSASGGSTTSNGSSNPSFRMSIGPGSRPSGLRAPSTSGLKAPSRVGGAHERTKSAAVMGSGNMGVSGVPRPSSGMGLRGQGTSGIMSSIERMGSYGHGAGGHYRG